MKRTATTVLVVDDEPDLRTLYELTLIREGFEVCTARDVNSALLCLQEQRFDVLITDMRLPDGQGLDLLAYLQAEGRSESSIVITAHGSADNAVAALKAGAFDYLTKPVELKSLRQVVAAAAARQGGLPVDSPKSAARARVSPPALARLVGASPQMEQVRQRISKVAPSMAPVLVLGESGTGKELVARAVHDCSHRSEGPFVAVNCAAIPESLIEAEFFGVRKGAYTGATNDRPGFFDAARGGTLFLDEIGDLPLAMQAKLLRAIQERRVRPVGSVQEESIDVRLVSATHRALAQRVEQGLFRQDLFYRLNVIEIRLPALRERLTDLPDLISALLQRLCAPAEGTMSLSVDAVEWLMRHPLPGNVRELENLLHKALALRTGQILRLCDFDDNAEHPDAPDVPLLISPTHVSPASPKHDAQGAQPADRQNLVVGHTDPEPQDLPCDLQKYLDEQERRVLIRALQASQYNRTAAANRLGLNLRQIRYRIQRLGITLPGQDDSE